MFDREREPLVFFSPSVSLALTEENRITLLILNMPTRGYPLPQIFPYLTSLFFLLASHTHTQANTHAPVTPPQIKLITGLCKYSTSRKCKCVSLLSIS